MPALDKLFSSSDTTFPNKFNIGKRQILTPSNIAKEMVACVVAKLKPEQWNKDLKIIDIYCKSGIFLYYFFFELFNRTRHLYIEDGLSNEEIDNRCRKHIIEHQLYGICSDMFLVALSTRTACGYIPEKSNIVFINNYDTIVNNKDSKFFWDAIREKFPELFIKDGEQIKMKKFGVVIGNPPYNNDAYLDFVTKGHQLLDKNGIECMITPAKWQAKGGEANETFRREMVPHMSEITYYPDCTDVFEIAEAGGISYYLMDKETHINIDIINKCKLQLLYNDKVNRSIINRETLINKGNKIVEKLKEYQCKFTLAKFDKTKQYQVWLNNKLAIGGGKSQGTYLFSNEGSFQCLSLSRVIDSKGDTSSIIADSQLIFSSNNISECEYFVSWIKTRLVRYLISINLAGLTGVANPNNDWWRFVPDPGKFDHIFTDAELYKKYNLTDEEIKIIESVIKERK